MSATEFSSQQVSRLIGVSLRQLNYWRKTDLVAPSRKTRGGHARYSFNDLVALKAVCQLIKSGVSLQQIRQNIVSLLRFLPTLDRPLSEISLVATGDVVLVFHQGSVFEALSGQEWVLEIADLQEQAAAVLNKTEHPYQHTMFDDEKEAIPMDRRRSGGVNAA